MPDEYDIENGDEDDKMYDELDDNSLNKKETDYHDPDYFNAEK